jgi:hypothetical protein
MIISGQHQYCDNCGMILFQVTDEYIEDSCRLLGSLVSNTKYENYETFKEGVRVLIGMHLPMLEGWLSTITYGCDKMYAGMLNTIRTHAINLEIPDADTLAPAIKDTEETIQVYNGDGTKVLEFKRKEE